MRLLNFLLALGLGWSRVFSDDVFSDRAFSNRSFIGVSLRMVHFFYVVEIWEARRILVVVVVLVAHVGRL